MDWRRQLLLLLGVTLALSLLWTWAIPLDTPPYQAHYGNWLPDEADHLANARYWARHGHPPPYGPPYLLSLHPPLFHWLAGQLIGEERPAILARLLCVLLGLGTVACAALTAKTLAGPRVGLLAGAIIGLHPMRLTHSAGIGNENLATLFAAATLLLLARLARYRRLRLWEWLALGACLMLAVGTKVTCIGLYLAALPLLWWRIGPVRALGLLLLCSLGSIGLWGGWLEWNRLHYGDWLKNGAARAFWDVHQPGFAIVHARDGMPLWRYVFAMGATGFRSFWAAFDGLSKMLPSGAYLPPMLWTVLALKESVRRRRAPASHLWRTGVGLYAAFLVVVFVHYNYQCFSAQGRYFFGLLTPLALWLAHGWLRLFPVARRRIAGALLVLVLLLADMAFLWIYPPWR